MLKCRRMRGLIAASLYEDLASAERTTLDAHLAKCDACRAQHEALQAFTSRIAPSPVPELGFGLMPRLRHALDGEQSAKSPRGAWRWSLAATMCVLLVALVGYGAAQLYIQQHEQESVVAAVPPSPVLDALSQAAQRQGAHDFTGAYRTLKAAIEAHPDDLYAGEAEVQLAELAFTNLNWYPEAYAAYESLARNYPKLYTANAEAIARRDLLSEAREEDYAPLYALDAARRSATDTFAQLERVVAHYPATFVASLAAGDMARLMEDEVSGSEGGNRHLLAMECAKDRCKHPLAIARLKIEIGNIYLKELNNPSKARDCYTEVASSEDGVIGALARNSLATLDSANPSSANGSSGGSR